MIGFAITKAPIIAWIFLGALGGLLFLQAPTYVWVCGSFLVATLSRIIVATGFVPGIFNFFHFPLALGAVIVASIRSDSSSQIASSVRNGIIALLMLSIVSWTINGGGFLRPLLTWLVFCEPFLFVYALVKDPPDAKTASHIWKLTLGVAFIQLPLGIWQAATIGLCDHVQGTFVGMGAGHHVAGAVALIGTLICVAKGSTTRSSIKKLSWLLGGILLFIFPVLSDAKQCIAAFVPASICLMFILGIVRWHALFITLPIYGIVISVAFFCYQPLQLIFDWPLVSHGIFGKVEAFFIIANKLSEISGAWLLGVGPGNSVSRVALMGIEGYVNPCSPVHLLGLKAASTTQEIWWMTYSNWLFSRSSAWSGISSWLGLFGDLGLIGISLYVGMSWKLWRALKGRASWEIAVAKGVLVMAGVLGVIFSWLEEPGFTLLVAIVVGLALTVTKDEDGFIQNLGRP